MLRRLLQFFRPRQLEADIHEEIEFHRAHSSGSFGNATLVADHMRDASTIAWLETFAQDIRYGFRQLLKSPVLLAVAVLSLALGIGANTAIFTLINAVMLQMLPVRDPASLVLLYDDISTGTSTGDLIGDAIAYPFYRDLRSHNTAFQEFCAFRQGNDRVTMHVAGDPETRHESVPVHLVSGNYFDVLGVKAAAGRLLRDSDDTPASVPAAVMSYGLWKDRFHLDPGILGKTVVLNGTAFTLAGVADSQFFGERVQTAPEFWLPLSFQPQIDKSESLLNADHTFWLNMMGRLKPNVALKLAEAATTAELHKFYLAQAGSHPTADARHRIERVQITLKAGGAGISGVRYRFAKPLRVLMAIVALVLIIACANIATLLLARASARRQEFLCRLALGAGRARLLRQVLTESILLAIIGGVAGALLAWWCVKTLVLLLQFDPVVKVRPDHTVLAFTVALSIATGVLFGIIPAWKFSHLDPRPGNVVPRGWRLRRFSSTQTLIGLQIALSLSLLIVAGLLAQSLLALETQNVGFTRDRILLMRTDADLAGYKEGEVPILYQELERRMRDLPGVQSATLARFSPVSGYDSSENLSIQGVHPAVTKDTRMWDLPVGTQFFETLRIPLLLGRTFNARDTGSSTPVAVVNKMFVDEYLRGVNPLGQHVSNSEHFKAPGLEIVGVVADSKFFDLRSSAKPMIFYPIGQAARIAFISKHPIMNFELMLRTAADPNAVAAEVRGALKQINDRLPIEQNTLNEQIESSLQQQKLITSLCGIFGVLALLLASIGIYGTLAYAVAGRTSEIGIRMAIGAKRSDVVSLVLRDLVFVLFAGLIAGLPFAFGATRWLQSFLFGVKPLDTIALGGSVLLIAAVALLAGYFPARRAAKIDPMRALRHE